MFRHLFVPAVYQANTRHFVCILDYLSQVVEHNTKVYICKMLYEYEIIILKLQPLETMQSNVHFALGKLQP